MSHRDTLGDALVLTMTQGMSLEGWRACGTLDREWAMYATLAPHYRRMVVVTYGELQRDRAIAAAIAGRPDIIQGPLGHEADWPSEAAGDVLRLAGSSGRDVGDAGPRIVIKTNQFKGGMHAAALARALRTAGVSTTLIARGGYDDTVSCGLIYGPDHDEVERARVEEAALAREADMFVSTSPRARAALLARRGIDEAMATVVPNYVVMPEQGAFRERAGWLTVGRLEPQKRLDVLIEAQRMLGADAPPLTIVGEGSLRGQLEAQARGLDVRFVGQLSHDDVQRAMLGCAVYAQASGFEGHPKTVIEAMGCGAALVVADAPGLGEVVEHGVTGLVCPGRPEAFANAIAPLIRDSNARRALGELAQQHAEAMYSIESITAREIEMHRASIARSRDRACVAKEVA